MMMMQATAASRRYSIASCRLGPSNVRLNSRLLHASACLLEPSETYNLSNQSPCTTTYIVSNLNYQERRYGRDGIATVASPCSLAQVSKRIHHLSQIYSAASFSTAAANADNDDDESTASTKTIPFLLADIGEGILEVELLQWFVAEGDTIHQFDKVCEVQSDKATVEITSRYDGVVVKRSGGNVGDLVRVGQPLLMVRVEQQEDGDHGSDGHGASQYNTGGQDSAASSEGDKACQYQYERLRIPSIGSQYHLQSDSDGDELETDGARTMSASSGKFQASPAVRKLGTEYKMDLSTIRPSGPNGRLLKSDVMTYLKEQGLWREFGASSAADDTDMLCPQSTGTSMVSSISTPSTQDEIIQLKGYNRLMVQTMTASLQIPHMGFSDELVINKLLECRKELNSSCSNTNISLLGFLTKAASLAMSEFPMVNAIVHNAADYQVQIKADHNIGIAMDTPRGLVVPVLKKIQTKTLLQLQEELNELKQLAAASQLTQDHLSHATFTLSNIGSMGCGTYMQPIIVSPQLAMGAIGSVQTLPRFASDMDRSDGGDLANRVIAAKVLNVSWAGDHRFLDGATLARFHKSFKRYVEHPVHMLAHLK